MKDEHFKQHFSDIYVVISMEINRRNHFQNVIHMILMCNINIVYIYMSVFIINTPKQ